MVRHHPSRPWQSPSVEIVDWKHYGPLLLESLRLGGKHVAGMVPYWLRGDYRTTTAEPAMALKDPPVDPWVAAAHKVIVDVKMSDAWWHHSERTWHFAVALAAVDGTKLNEVDLYVASLLHDTGFYEVGRQRCFAATGAAHAFSTAADVGIGGKRVQAVADAIFGHISVKPPTELACYVRAGSLLDLAGTRVWELDRAMVDQVCAKWPRDGFPGAARRSWADECARFPNGRAAFARRPGALLAASYVSTLPE